MRSSWLWAPLLVSMACSADSHTEKDRDGSDEPDASEPADEPDAAEPRDEPEAGPDVICASCGGCEELQKGLSYAHKPEPITYSDPPPTGGDHASCWASYGVHTQAVPEARWVHNLEHGAVVFLHNCPRGCASEIKQLAEIAQGRSFALVTPDARLPTRFAVVAWGVRLLSDCVDAEAFQSFYEKHVDQAAESTSSGPPGGC